MDYLLIRNAGEMELEALTLMGATSKNGDSTKIGFFGSGNKYALATLLRHDIGVTIFSGTKEYLVGCEPVVFRGEEYKRILINGQPTSLTTRMGPAWEPWMAIRELYCNAIDEGLLSFGEVPEVQGSADGETAIYVEITTEIQDFLDHKGEYFNEYEVLEATECLYGRVDILDSQKGARFRKNIACINDPCKSLYSYNFDNITINESRLIQYDHQQYEQMACALAASKVPAIVANVIGHINEDDILEARAKWGSGYCTKPLSPVWEQVLIGLAQPVVPQSVAEYLGTEETHNCIKLPDELVEKIKRDLPNVLMFGDFNGQSCAATPSPELVEEVQRCMALLVTWGFEEQVFSYRKFLCSDVLAQLYNGQIYLSIELPIHMVLETIYEEITHKITGLRDATRAFQDYLFREIIRLQKELHK